MPGQELPAFRGDSVTDKSLLILLHCSMIDVLAATMPGCKHGAERQEQVLAPTWAIELTTVKPAFIELCKKRLLV